jgi:adenylate cyclase
MAVLLAAVLRNRLALSIVISLAVAIILSLLFFAGFLSNYEPGISDNLYTERPVSDNIAIVGIDDKSLQEIGRWPWDRENFARMISLLQESGAGVIGIDVSFFEKSASDRKVEEVLEKNSSNVVFVKELGNFSVENSELITGSSLDPVFSGNYGAGFANIFTDPDGIVRSFPTEIRSANGSYSKHFSLAVLEQYLGEPLDLGVPDALVNYFGPAGHFTTLSFSDVLNNRTGTDFHGKIVLIGATAPGLRDTFLTPVSHAQEMSGVEIHASIIETIQTGSFLHNQEPLSIVLVIFIFCLAAGALLYRVRLSFATLAIAVITIAYIFFSSLQFEAGTVMNILYPLLALACVYVADVGLFYMAEKKQRGFVTSIFGKYVSKEVAAEILRKTTSEELMLKGEKREITIMFTDIRHFTSISERMRPEGLVRFLNAYLSDMTGIIMKNKGIVDKYIGDAIMAFWGAPLDEKRHAVMACSAALDMKKSLEESKSEFRIGIGLNTGPAIAGNMGSSQRVNYTVIGDTVNAASRLEGLNKEYGTMIIAGEPTCNEAKQDFVFRELDLIRVKGKNIPIRIYELLGRKNEVGEKTMLISDHFQKGLEFYRQKKWKQAVKEFDQALRIGKDPPSEIFIRRCIELQKHPPKAWDGVFTMKTK